jgi:hypothetical protein
MRFLTAILVIVQLLVRGVAVPHCPAQSETANHAHRPHIHFSGHSHTDAKHGHSHRHGDRHEHAHAPVAPQRSNSSRLAAEHDQDAVYFDGQTLTESVDRTHAPQPTASGWCLSATESGPKPGLDRLIDARAAGPPGAISNATRDLLPHLLRI